MNPPKNAPVAVKPLDPSIACGTSSKKETASITPAVNAKLMDRNLSLGLRNVPNRVPIRGPRITIMIIQIKSKLKPWYYFSLVWFKIT